MAKIFETRKGVRRELKSSEIKSRVMKQRGWTSDKYNKEYDKLRNRLRAYERYQEARGVPVEKQSPAILLYRESQARRREGANYTPSKEMQRIQSFPSISSGKALDKRLEEKLFKFDKIYGQKTKDIFGGFIEANPVAREIWTRVKDPVKREQALKDYIAKVKIKESDWKNATKNSAIPIPYGQAVGSRTPVEFNINDYL